MNDTLKAAGHIGAELAAAKADLQREMERHRKTWRQLEQVTGLLREAGEYGGLTPSWHSRRDAALSQQAEPAPAQDEREFNTSDDDLTKLLNIAADLVKGNGGMDLGVWFAQVLERVEMRLAALAHPAEAQGVEVVAYATPNEDGHWQMLFFDEKEAMLYTDDGQPAPLVLRSAHIAALSSVTAERDALREQVKVLQSDANSWQSGYDKGRHDGTKHRQSEVEQLRQHKSDYMEAAEGTRRALAAEVEALRKDAERYRWLREQEAKDGIAVLPVGRWEKPAMLCTTPFDSPEMVDAVVDAALAAKEA